MKSRNLAWHFVGKTLRDGRPIPEDGVWLEHEGPIVICESGLHASREPFDALQYAPGATLCLVEVDDVRAEQRDKLVCARRKIVARMDATEVMLYFARMQALSVVHLWDAPDVVLDYLMTGDESIRAAARSAARSAARGAVWDAARDAAWSAAWGAAWGAARSAAWDAARAAVRDATWGAARSAAWDAARDAAWSAAWGAARSAAWDAARDAVRGAVRGAAWGAARDAARGAARGAARDAARDAARGAARDELSALVHECFEGVLK